MIRCEKTIPKAWKVWYKPLLQILDIGFVVRSDSEQLSTLLLYFDKDLDKRDKMKLLDAVETVMVANPEATEYFTKFHAKLLAAGIIDCAQYSIVKEMKDAGMTAEEAAEKFIRDYNTIGNT